MTYNHPMHHEPHCTRTCDGTEHYLPAARADRPDLSADMAARFAEVRAIAAEAIAAIGTGGHSHWRAGGAGGTCSACEAVATERERLAAALAAVSATAPRSMCPECGPGYRYGDEGCRHTAPTTVAATKAECPFGSGDHRPLIRQAKAEALESAAGSDRWQGTSFTNATAVRAWLRERAAALRAREGE